MFERLSNFFSPQRPGSDLSKQLEIIKVFDIYREAVKNLPQAEGVKLVSLRNKILTIAVPSAAAASELRLREEQIKGKINEQLRKEAVRRMAYRF